MSDIFKTEINNVYQWAMDQIHSMVILIMGCGIQEIITEKLQQIRQVKIIQQRISVLDGS